MDGAILVVACTDGTMPQTKEHLLLANQVISYCIQYTYTSTKGAHSFFQPVAQNYWCHCQQYTIGLDWTGLIFSLKLQTFTFIYGGAPAGHLKALAMDKVF